jgi:hypothetical protein
MKHVVITAIVCAAFAQSAAAQSGPVANACKADIAKYCADAGHGNRQTRTCLETNKAKVSQICKTALETTGGGMGRRSGILSTDQITTALEVKGYSNFTTF